MTGIINRGIDSSKFPKDLKLANVTPVFKKVDRLNVGNYRPVSVLPSLSKIYENVIAQQLTDYFDEYFSTYLSAFRKGYSCITTLVRLLEDWKKALDNKNVVGAVLMDLSKAFDCMPHDLFVAKLAAYSIGDQTVSLLGNYLSDRMQRVKIGSCNVSQWKNIVKGIPQGSIVGPLAFNIFLNDLFYHVKNSVVYNYADDNTLSYQNRNVNTVVNTLQEESNVAIEWFKRNEMLVNPDKFQALLLGCKEEDINFNIDNCIVKPESHVCLLGINIDNKLTFEYHIEQLICKAARQLNVLRRLNHMLDIDSKMAIFRSFVISNLEYGSIVWHFCTEKMANRLECIQKRALRFVYSDYTSSYQDLLAKANTCTLATTRKRKILQEVYKIVHNICPPYLCDLFTLKTSTRSSRAQFSVVQPRRRTTKYGINSISYTGAKMWNSLSNNVRLASSLQEFKSYITQWDNDICKCNKCKFLS